MASPQDTQLEQLALHHARHRLDRFAHYLPDVRDINDIEDVHQLRVAWRRFRTAVRLFSDVLPMGGIRRLQKGAVKLLDHAGTARDLDVQIEALTKAISGIDELSLRPGPRRLCLRLQQAREKVQPKLAKAADKLLDSDLVGKVQRKLEEKQASLPETDAAPAGNAAIWQHAWLNIDVRMEAVHGFQPWLADPGAIEQHHAMRSEVRKLRYAAEIFAPLVGERMDGFINQLKDLQDHLGAMHDCDVWIHSRLPEFIVSERQRTVRYFGQPRGFARLQRGIEAFAKETQQTRDRHHQALLELWRQLEEEAWWARFRQLLLEERESSHHLAGANLQPPNC